MCEMSCPRTVIVNLNAVQARRITSALGVTRAPELSYSAAIHIDARSVEFRPLGFGITQSRRGKARTLCQRHLSSFWELAQAASSDSG